MNCVLLIEFVGLCINFTTVIGRRATNMYKNVVDHACVFLHYGLIVKV
jgi:hypothetical protein